MTTIKFVKPNFICKIAHRSKPEKWRRRILYAESAESAVKFLEAGHFIVHADGVQPYDYDADWLQKAQHEQSIANAEFPDKTKKYEWKNRIWKEMKDHLQDLFSNKCAYCDADFAHVSWGDVEHYRPKSAVTDADGNAVDHPGYYWLAYDPSNYLPSCSLCNSGEAKQNRFPIKGKYATRPGDKIEAEEPLLLNPYHIDFAEHLRFGTSLDKNPGFVSSRDEPGKVSIKVYDLNRKGLPEKRSEEQENAKNAFSQAWVTKISTAGKVDSVDQVIRRYRNREKPFSAAVLDELRTFAGGLNLSFPSDE